MQLIMFYILLSTLRQCQKTSNEGVNPVQVFQSSPTNLVSFELLACPLRALEKHRAQTSLQGTHALAVFISFRYSTVIHN